jgi:hypothetical protein
LDTQNAKIQAPAGMKAEICDALRDLGRCYKTQSRQERHIVIDLLFWLRRQTKFGEQRSGWSPNLVQNVGERDEEDASR